MRDERRATSHAADFATEIVATRLGPVGVTASSRSVRQVRLLREARRRTREPVPVTAAARRLAARARKELKEYLDGARRSLDLRPDLSTGTPFQQAVWRTLRTIPYGEVRSYGWVAKRIGQPRASRAVGAACGANPVPILVPCHRVVAGDGSLGGFSCGLPWKRRLLALEGTLSQLKR